MPNALSQYASMGRNMVDHMPGESSVGFFDGPMSINVEDVRGMQANPTTNALYYNLIGLLDAPGRVHRAFMQTPQQAIQNASQITRSLPEVRTEQMNALAPPLGFGAYQQYGAR